MSKATSFTIKKSYMLTAINKAGERVYFDIDSHSGGYPYWSTYYNDRTYDSLDKIPTIGPKDYLRNEVTRIEVPEVEIQARVVSTTEIVSEARAKAEAEITQIRKELARKLAQLEGVK